MTKATFKNDTDFARNMAQSKIRMLTIQKKLMKEKAIFDTKNTISAIKNLIANEQLNIPGDLQKFVNELEEKTLHAIEKL